MRVAAIFAIVTVALGQRVPPPPPKADARIEGNVIVAATKVPLRRARVTINPLEAGRSSISAETDEKGRFEIRDIVPGRYTLTATREGYLDTSVFLKSGYRMPAALSIVSRDNLTGLSFHMQTWSVITGKIKFDDGEPAPGIRVELYKEFHQRGKRLYRAVSTVQTNDRGEYRAYNLAAGDYFVAGVYERASDQPKLDGEGRELSPTGLTTTFYPNTTKLAEALAVHVGQGQEVGGIEIFLRPVRKVKVSGIVTSGISGAKLTTATIMMQRLDAHNSGALPLSVRTTFDRDANFEIKDVAPGAYMVFAQGTESSKTMTTQVPLLVNDDTTGVELLLRPDIGWSSTTRMEPGRLSNARYLRVSLEPRSEQGVNVDASNGTFSIRAEETYDVMIDNLPDDAYISAVNVSGSNMLASGVRGTMASREPMEIVLDSRGGKITGRVYGPDGDVWSGAGIALIPEPAEGRLQAYRVAGADQTGLFQLRGIPPGRYTLTAWMEDPPCDIYASGEALKGCREVGMAIDVPQSSAQSLNLLIRAPR